MTHSTLPAYPFTNAQNASDATQFDPKASNRTYYMALAKSKHPEKALHIALLTLRRWQALSNACISHTKRTAALFRPLPTFQPG